MATSPLSLTKWKTKIGIQEEGASWSLNFLAKNKAQIRGSLSVLKAPHMSIFPGPSTASSQFQAWNITPNLALKQTTRTKTKNPETVRTLRKWTLSVPFLTYESSLQHKTENYELETQRMPQFFPCYSTKEYLSGTWATRISSYLYSNLKIPILQQFWLKKTTLTLSQLHRPSLQKTRKTLSKGYMASVFQITLNWNRSCYCNKEYCNQHISWARKAFLEIRTLDSRLTVTVQRFWPWCLCPANDKVSLKNATVTPIHSNNPA